MEEKGKRRFERQFQDALQSLEAQLNVGYSMENAIKEVQRDLQIMYDRHGLELMMALFSVIQGMVSTIMQNSGFGGDSDVIELPAEMVEKIESVGLLDSIPLWIVTLLGSLFITVLSFIMILTVYGRMFKLYMYTAIAPIPIATFAGEPTQNIGKNFVRSYAGVCMEGAIIALACIIFSVFAASPPAIADSSLSAVNIVWNYVAELIFNLLVLVGAIKAADRIVKEIMGL